MSSGYEIRLRGVASERLLESLCGDLEMKADTVLHGVIRDQAELHGLLARIRDVGAEVIDLHRLNDVGD